jgi:hypothetical protein
MMSIFNRFFGGKSEPVKSAVATVQDIERLKLMELADPFFPYILPNDRLTEVPTDSPLYPAITARNEFPNKLSPSDYFNILNNALLSCPKEDLPYYWIAELYLIQDRYEEAKRWALEGLTKAHECERLAFITGSIYLRMMNPIAIGWFIQSCLLGTFEFIPYLFCSHCADVVGLKALSRKLLNASDAISPGRRVPDAEFQVISLAKGITHSQLLQAMTKFDASIQNYLPAADVFPDNPDQRDVYVWAHYNDICRDICKRLYSRRQMENEKKAR